MRYTFQIERWPAIAAEIKPLLYQQWQEIALDRERIPYDPEWQQYDALDAADVLHITTVRAGAELAGYYVNVLRAHPHYRTTLFGFLDIFYVVPAHRKATVGLRLFQAMLAAVKARGVVELVSISKCHAPTDLLFQRTGWRLTGHTYTKLL